MNNTNETIRLGYYHDGGFLDYVSKNFRSDIHDGLDIKGVEMLSRYYIAKHKRISMMNTDISVREYFRGQFSAAEAKAYGPDVLERDRNKEQMLRHLGYQIHLYPMKNNKEKGVDVALAVQMLLDAHHNRFDCAVLFSGDGDFVPLVNAVKCLGKEVVVFDWDCRTPGASTQKTSRALLSTASWPIDIMRMIERPDADDRIYVEGLFLKPSVRPVSTTSQPRKASHAGVLPTDATIHQATVTYWGATATAKGFGYAKLPDGTALPCGARINSVCLMLAGMVGQGAPPKIGEVVRILSIAPNSHPGYEGTLFAASWSKERPADNLAAA